MTDKSNGAGAPQIKVDILGVYPVEITRQKLVDDAIAEFGEGRFNLDDILEMSDEELQDWLWSIYLIEVIIEGAGCRIDLGDFTQAEEGLPPSEWQVAYDEKFMDATGTVLMEEPVPEEPMRAAFFFHCLDFAKPLLSPAGPLQLPEPLPMPDRLRPLFRYFPP